jgi:hypothetical protein
MAASTQMTAGDKRLRLFTAALVHPAYMYKMRQINKVIHRFICLNHLSQSLLTLFTTRYQALRSH